MSWSDLPPIVHVAAGLGQGGTERSIELFATGGFGPAGQSVVVLDQGGATEQRLRSAGVSVTVCGGDLSHAAGAILAAGTNPAVLMNRAGRPEGKWHDLMRRLRGQATLIDMNHFGWLDRPAYDLGLQGVWCVSGTALAKYLRLYAGDVPSPRQWRGLPVAVAAGHNPVSDQAPSSLTRAAARQALNLPLDVPIAVRIGRPDPRKWSDLIVPHFDAIRDAVPDLHILFLAAPENRKTWLARHLGERAIFRDFTSDRAVIEQALAASDVMLHYARYGESFGYAIAEASVMELPCVVLATPWGDNAQQELILHGKTGYVTRGARETAQYLSWLLRDEPLRQTMGKAARDHILAQYGVAAAWDLLADFIRHVRAGGKGLIQHPAARATQQAERLAQGFASYHEAFPKLTWLRAQMPLWGDPAFWKIFCQDGIEIVQKRLKR